MQPHRRTVAIAYLLSGLLHAGLVAGMLWLVLPLAPSVDTQPIGTAVRPAAGDNVAPASAVAALSDDEDGDEAALPTEDALSNVDTGTSRVAEFARNRYEQALSEAEGKPVAEQLEDLEELGERLSRISSDKSVAEVAAVVAPWIGGSSRATVPESGAGVEGDFDVSTAQISDVLNQEVDGEVHFVAIMVDAAGRSQLVPLDPADGESLFETFQLMKRFPLLETVYRNTVMGLLDQVLEEESSAEASSVESGEKDRSLDDEQAGESN